MNFLKILTVLFLLLPGLLMADGGEDYCGERRDLNRNEKAWADGVINSLAKTLPAAIKDWTMEASHSRKIDFGQACTKQGNPIQINYSVVYKNEKKMKAITENMSKNSDRIGEEMGRLAEEMNQAIQKGEMDKIKPIQKKMLALQGGSANELSTRIEIRINTINSNESKYQSKPFPLPGTKFSYIIEKEDEKKVIFYLGNWRKSGDDGVAYIFNIKAPNTSVSFVEIVIKGEIADQLAKSLNIKALHSLVK